MKLVDEYGFGSAAFAGVRLFEETQRGTGRTSRLIERVKDGDAIVVISREQADLHRRLLRDARKKGVSVLVWDNGTAMSAKGRVAGRFILDHVLQAHLIEKAIKLELRRQSEVMHSPSHDLKPDSELAYRLSRRVFVGEDAR